MHCYIPYCTELSVNIESGIPAVFACEKLSNQHWGSDIRPGLKTNKEFVCCARARSMSHNFFEPVRVVLLIRKNLE